MKITSPGFKGNVGLNEADIAAVVLDNYIIYNPHTAPICMDLNIRYQSEREIAQGTMALVAGWGNTGYNQVESEFLRSIEIPVVSHEKCKSEASEDFDRYILPGLVLK